MYWHVYNCIYVNYPMIEVLKFDPYPINQCDSRVHWWAATSGSCWVVLASFKGVEKSTQIEVQKTSTETQGSKSRTLRSWCPELRKMIPKDLRSSSGSRDPEKELAIINPQVTLLISSGAVWVKVPTKLTKQHVLPCWHHQKHSSHQSS